MGLKQIPLKRSYDSDIDDILHEFYIPALSEAIYYRRLVGFFSSTSLAIAAKGICHLIQNGGIIELVTSPRFQENDIEAMQHAFDSPENIIE
jgi:hypothetical protein